MGTEKKMVELFSTFPLVSAKFWCEDRGRTLGWGWGTLDWSLSLASGSLAFNILCGSISLS